MHTPEFVSPLDSNCATNHFLTFILVPSDPEFSGGDLCISLVKLEALL